MFESISFLETKMTERERLEGGLEGPAFLLPLSPAILDKKMQELKKFNVKLLP